VSDTPVTDHRFIAGGLPEDCKKAGLAAIFDGGS